MEITHTPVLLEETLHYLSPRGGGELMIDATLGEGGHSLAFLTRFSGLSLIGIDADPSIQEIAKQRLAGFGGRVQYYTGRAQDFFASYPTPAAGDGQKRPDTVLADLGVSMFHYEKSGRGFSFRGNEPLDMRIDTSRGPTAAELIARMPEKDIADMLYNNADERFSRRIARAIVQGRSRGAVSTTAALAELVERAVPAKYKYGPIHPATRTFQALRIAVNGELSGLPNLLEGALDILKPGGRLGIISFHSLEDRIVKNFFKTKNTGCVCSSGPYGHKVPCSCGNRKAVNILTRKGVTAGEAELKTNPPSRSARLRVVEKIPEAEKNE